MEHFQPVNDKLQLDKMWDCSCGKMKVMYCCTRETSCSREGVEQRFYCGFFCLGYHDHMPKPISQEYQEQSNKWKSLFEKIQRVYQNSTQNFRQLKDIIEFCEEGNSVIPVDMRYNGTQNYRQDFQWIEELNEKAEKQKHKIEDLVQEGRVEELIKCEQERILDERIIQALEYLEQLTEDVVFKRYYNVFLKHSIAAYDKYSIETLQQLIRLKEKAFRLQRNELNDFQPQNYDPASLLEDKTQVNFDLIQIVDHKHSMLMELQSTECQQIKDRLENQEIKITQQELMIKEQRMMIEEQKRMIIDRDMRTQENQQEMIAFQQKMAGEYKKFLSDQIKTIDQMKSAQTEQQAKAEEQRIKQVKITEDLKNNVAQKQKMTDQLNQKQVQLQKEQDQLRELMIQQNKDNEELRKTIAFQNKKISEYNSKQIDNQKKTEEQAILIDQQNQIVREQKEQITQLTSQYEDIVKIIGLGQGQTEEKLIMKQEEEVKEGWERKLLKQSDNVKSQGSLQHQNLNILQDIYGLQNQIKERILQNNKIESDLVLQNERINEIVTFAKNDRLYNQEQILKCKSNMSIQLSMIQKEDWLLISRQQFIKYDYLRVFHQLNSNGNILCCGNDQKHIKLYDQFTLQSTQSINVNNIDVLIFAILEHKQYLFICDGNYTVFMIDNNDYNVISKHYDTKPINKSSIEIVDDNTLIMGTSNGYLCLYDISNSILSLKYQQQLFINQSVSQIIRINNSNQYLLRVSGNGIKVIEMQDNSFNVIDTYFDKQYVTAMIQYHQNYLLCSCQNDKKYYIVDINNKTCTHLVTGYDYCFAMSLLPGFDLDTFPYVIAKEKEQINIINIKKKKIQHYYKCPSGLIDHQGSQILFLKDQGYRFITYGEKGEILLFSLSHNLIENLRKN